MKKKILLALLIFITAFYVYAYGEYMIPNSSFQYVYGDGYSGANYCGNTKTLSALDVHNNRMGSSWVKGFSVKDFSGKMSYRQSRLVNHALNQFKLEVGDIYSVGFYEISDMHWYYGITAEITKVNSDGSYSYTWYGFCYYIK